MAPDGLWTILSPVIVSSLVLLSAGFLNRRFAPLQQDTLRALQARIAVLEAERNECKTQLENLTHQVAELSREIRDLTAENLDLRRPESHRVRKDA